MILLAALGTLALFFLLGLHAADYRRALANLLDFLGELRPDPQVLGDAAYALYETVVMSLFSTTAATLVALPLAAAAAVGIWPAPAAAAVRALATLARTVPALLWGVLGVVMFGPGPVAGAAALTIYSVGYLVKLFYETLENVDPQFMDAMRAMGARGLALAYLAYRQQSRQIATNVAFILEYNVRTATIMGFVGAGGVGYYISQYLSLLKYDAAATLVLTVFAFVIALEAASYLARRTLK